MYLGTLLFQNSLEFYIARRWTSRLNVFILVLMSQLKSVVGFILFKVVILTLGSVKSTLQKAKCLISIGNISGTFVGPIESRLFNLHCNYLISLCDTLFALVGY